MQDVKLEVLEEIKKLMDGRMAGKLKPKSVEVSVEAEGKKPEGEMEAIDEGSAPEKPEFGSEEPVAEEASAPGMGKLSPEEQEQLKALYQKMMG